MTRHLPIHSDTGARPRRNDGAASVTITINGATHAVAADASIRDACEQAGVEIPTLCFAKNLTPVNVCRVCVVEVTGARTLVPSCSRRVEAGMAIATHSPRVLTARKVVFELLAASADLSATPNVTRWMNELEAAPARMPVQAQPMPPTDDNNLFVRDYGKCILCYKCVEACGTDAQNTFAIAVGGRGEHAHITTEFKVSLPDSACVFCGNCIGVCPTGALVFSQEHELRKTGAWDETQQKEATTTCPYCGVGCALTLRTQANHVVRVTSPADHSVTNGHLCIKGRFGWGYVGDPRDQSQE